MSEERKRRDDAASAKPGQCGGGERSPASSEDREREKTGRPKQPGSTTDEIDGARADEDTHD